MDWKEAARGIGLGVILFVGLLGAMVTARGVGTQQPQQERLLSAYNAAGGTWRDSPQNDQYWTEVRLLDGTVMSGEMLQKRMEEHAEAGDLSAWMKAYVNTSPIEGRSYVFKAFKPNALLGFTDRSEFAELLFLGCSVELPEQQVVQWRGEVSSAACVNYNCQIVVAYFGEQ